MLKAFLLILVLSVLAFAFLELLFRPTPIERTKPSEGSAEKKARAARAGGRYS